MPRRNDAKELRVHVEFAHHGVEELLRFALAQSLFLLPRLLRVLDRLVEVVVGPNISNLVGKCFLQNLG